MRPARAAVEPGVDPGALERILEQAEILTRRAQEHRHFVEANTGARFVEDASGDLDTFAALAGRREQAHVAARRAFSWLPRREE